MSRPSLRQLAVCTALLATAAGGAFAAGVSVGHRSRSGGLLDEAAATIGGRADHAVSRRDLDAAAIRGMLGALDDRWAAFYGVPSDAAATGSLQALLDGRYSGLGLWLRRQGTDRQLVVASVSKGSPAQAAGLQVGDLVVAVDGRPVSGGDLEAATAALRGPAGSAVQLAVVSAGHSRTVRLERRSLPASSVSSEPLPGGLVRIRIAMFSAGTAQDLGRAVRTAVGGGARGLVLDLRGNPGGLLDQAVGTASAFLDGGPVVRLSGREVPEQVLQAAAGHATAVPLAVLVDGGTASAAEVVAGALQDRGRAVLVGSRTFGKGSVQQTVRLADGSAVELTVATYRTPAGHPVDGVGLVPDVTVPASADAREALDRARSVLGALSGAGRS